MGNDLGRNKLSAKNVALLKRWLTQLLLDHSQHELAKLLGISQSLISDILRDKKTPSLGTLQLAVRNAAKRHLVILPAFSGTLYAVGRYEGIDPMRNRGRALDILSAEYDDDFCKAVIESDPPPRSDGWTVEEWLEFLTQQRKTWRLGRKLSSKSTGIFALPPGNPPKN